MTETEPEKGWLDASKVDDHSDLSRVREEDSVELLNTFADKYLKDKIRTELEVRRVKRDSRNSKAISDATSAALNAADAARIANEISFDLLGQSTESNARALRLSTIAILVTLVNAVIAIYSMS